MCVRPRLQRLHVDFAELELRLGPILEADDAHEVEDFGQHHDGLKRGDFVELYFYSKNQNYNSFLFLNYSKLI